MRRRWPMMVVKILVFGTIAVLVFGQIVTYLWNWLMPSLFGLHVITFWQALGLMALSWILFGGLRGSGRHHRGDYRGWRHRMRERWEHMTPEERERFRQGMRGCCGPFEASTPEPKAGS